MTTEGGQRAPAPQGAPGNDADRSRYGCPMPKCAGKLFGGWPSGLQCSTCHAVAPALHDGYDALRLANTQALEAARIESDHWPEPLSPIYREIAEERARVDQGDTAQHGNGEREGALFAVVLAIEILESFDRQEGAQPKEDGR